MLNNPSELSENTESDSTGTTESEAVNGSGSPSENTNESEQELLYDIDGEEIPLATIKEWKAGHLRQSDYTKKTQAHAEESAKQKAERHELNERLNLLADLEADISSLVMGDLNGVNLDELIDVDPAEYLKTKNKIEQRQNALQAMIEKRNKLQAEHVNKSVEFLHKSLGWDDQSKRASDIEAISSYAKSKGYTDQEFNRITDPKVKLAFREAAEYQKLKADADSAKKKVLQAPKASKPATATTAKPLSLAERLYGKTK